jgi:hypothetical protein
VLCFQCLAPNSKLEAITDNNYLCKTFTITGIDNKTQSGVRIYPNPITDHFIIENPDLDIKNVKLYDMNGKVLINKVASDIRLVIETNNIKAGNYILMINKGDKIVSHHLTKKQ